MQTFLTVYPIAVLIIGCLAALGALFAGLWSAVVYATFSYDPNTNRNDADYIGQRCFFAALFMGFGCLAAIVSLAFVKWIVT